MSGGAKLVLMLAAIAVVCCLQCGCGRIANRRTPERVIRLDALPEELVVSPNGRHLAVLGQGQGVSMFDLEDGSVEPVPIGPLHPSMSNVPVRERGRVDAIAFSADGRQLAAAILKPSTLENPPVAGLAWKKSVDIWDVATKSVIESIDMSGRGPNVTAIRYSPDGRYVYVATDVLRRLDLQSKQVTVILRATATKLVQADQPSGARVEDVDVSPDGKTLAVALAHGVVLLDVATQRERFGLKTEKRVACAVAFSPDGKIVATVSGRVQLWNVETGVNEASFEDTFKQGYGNVTSVAFSHDQKILAAGINGGEHQPSYVAVWRVADRRHMVTYACHSGPLKHVAFLPGGYTLITGSFDRTLQFWDLKEFAAAPPGTAPPDSGTAPTDKGQKPERK